LSANGAPLQDLNFAKYAIAFAHYKFYDYPKALKYCKDLLNSPRRMRTWEALLINDLAGMSYLKMQQYDSSLVYFQKLLEIAPNYPDQRGVIGWKGIATGNIGLVYYLQKKYDVAIPNLLQGEELCTKTNIMDNTAAFAVYLANIYLVQKNTEAALKHLDIARDAAYKSNDLQNYCDLYTTLSDFYRRQGNTALTLQYLDSSLKFKDSFAVVKNINQKYNAEINVAEEGRKLREQLNENEKQRQILIRNGSIAITLMALVYVLLFYNRKLLKQKLRREQLLAEKQMAETELYSAQRLLSEFTRNITEKNQLIETLTGKQNDQVSNDVMVQLQHSTLVTDEQWEDFRELFEKVHPGYLYRIKEKLPGLTPAETRFMALTKLKLSNKEMSAMLGNSPEAIRQYRSRIRKKFNILEQNSIEDLAETI
jgi:tetratricopeptide (TPR) repeat protein/DNA-binding CsgD family transcriptional regulator